MITVDKINGLMYISLQHQKTSDVFNTVTTKVIDDGIMVDYDETQKKVIGIEIIDTETTKYLIEAIEDFQRNSKKDLTDIV
jgi:uncharacterized protein YuzE